MLMIRLQRTGRKNDPHFRIVVTEKETSVRGKYLEAVGFVDTRQKQRSVNKERVLYWLSKGAQLSPTVQNVLVAEKVVEEKKIAKHKKSKKPAQPEVQTAAPTGQAVPAAETAPAAAETAPAEEKA